MFKIKKKEVQLLSLEQWKFQWRSVEPLLRFVRCFSGLVCAVVLQQLANGTRLGGVF